MKDQEKIMTKKKDPLKEFSSNQLLQELIKRCRTRTDELHLESEMTNYEVEGMEDAIVKLSEIILE